MKKERDDYKEALREMYKKEPNIEKVIVFLNKSLKKGSPEAAYALWTWYFYGKNVKKNMKKAITLLRQAAKSNLPGALFDLAVSYEIGTGVKKNLKLAFEYYMKASLCGDSESIYEVGRCYYYGIGVNKNRRLARIWLDRAREIGVYRQKEDRKERKHSINPTWEGRHRIHCKRQSGEGKGSAPDTGHGQV